MKKVFTKQNVLTFLGALGAALVTMIVNRIQSKNDISETVKAVLEEERRQINEAAQENMDQDNQ